MSGAVQLELGNDALYYITKCQLCRLTFSVVLWDPQQQRTAGLISANVQEVNKNKRDTLGECSKRFSAEAPQMFSAQRKFQCCINMNLIVTECVLLCELCYECLCVTTLQDSMTSIPFTLLDHNRHHITRETTLLSLERGWSGGIREKTLQCLVKKEKKKKKNRDTHRHTSGAILQKIKQKKPPKKHTAAISRGLHNVSLEMVGHSDHFISSPSRDRLHGAQNVPVPPSLLVIISRPVAQSL